MQENTGEATDSAKWVVLDIKGHLSLSFLAPFVLWKQGASSSLPKMPLYLRDLTNALHLASARGREKTKTMKFSNFIKLKESWSYVLTWWA